MITIAYNRKPLLLLLLLLTPLLGSCERTDPPINTRFLAFGTLVDLTISGVSPEQAEMATAAIEQDFAEMHQAWHAWDPGPLGRVNRLLKKDESFAAPPSVLELIKHGKSLSAASDNLFNPAIGHLIDAWGFHRDDPEGHRPPQQELIDKLLQQNPRMSDIDIDGINLRCRNPAVKLDFGAFGKGYGIDLAITHLRELGVDNAILNAGGDLRAIGSRGDRPWRIAIRNASGDGVLGTIETSADESVFTSGDYERHFIWEGKRFHHIIDPRTGYPAVGTASITVLHTDAVTADAAATALFVAGPDGWYELAKRMGIRYVLLIDSEGTLHMNPAMQQRLQLAEDQHRVHISPPLTGDPGQEPPVTR
jgi:thiamine biosynthesis lipoprotein